MNFKMMTLVALVLLAVLTLGAVSASEDAGNLTAIDDGGDDLKVDESPVDDVNAILSDGNGTYFDDENIIGDDDENFTDFDDETEDDDIIISVYEGDEIPTAGEDIDEEFAAVSAPDGVDAVVVITSGGYTFFNKSLSDFDDDKISEETDYEDYIRYSISPLDVTFFDGLDDGAKIKIAVLDENDDELTYVNYLIWFGDDSFELESDESGYDVGDEDELPYYFDVASAYIDDDWDYAIEYGFSDGYTGTLAILLNGSEIYNEEIESGTTYLTVGELGLDNYDYGTYEIEFVYSGDDDHEGFTEYDNITLTYTFVAYHEHSLDFDWVEYNSSVIYEIRLPYEANGVVVYRINGKEYYKSVEGHTFDIIIDSEDISYGENNVTFRYDGDDYPSKTIEQSFICIGTAKFPEKVSFDETFYVTLLIPEDGNGIIKIYDIGTIDDNGEYCSSEPVLLAEGVVKNGFANLSISNLDMRRHVLGANFTGNYEIGLSGDFVDTYDEYSGVVVTVTPKITVPAVVWVDGNYTARFEIPSDLDGELEVTIGDEHRTFDFVDGIVTFELFNLDYIDEYDDPVSCIEYSCFDLYDTVPIKVREDNPNIDLTPDDYYQVIVMGWGHYYESFNTPWSAEGNLTIYLDGEYYRTEPIKWGSVEVRIYTDNLTVGKHDVRFEYSGDGYFMPTTAYDSFNVTSIRFEIPTSITIGMHMGSASTALAVLPKDATGEVNLIIDGVLIETEPIDEGSAAFGLSNLTYGNHTVTLVYQNGNYPSANKTSNVEAKYWYDLEFDELIYGNENACVQLPAGATGVVRAIIADKEYVALIDENGTARFNITGLLAGEYPTTVTYGGDDKYPAETAEFNVTVSYAICADYIDDKIYEGDLAKYSIRLILPENATGKLVIYKEDWSNDAVGYEVLKEIDLVNGRAEITYEELFNGTGDKYSSFDIVMRYVGDDYEVDDISSSFYVVGHEIIWPENDGHLILGETVYYTVKFSNNFTGYLRVYDSEQINGSLKYSILYPNINIINGTATFSLDCPQLGRYSYKMEYIGDDYEMEDFFAKVVWPENVTLLQEASGDDVVFEVQMPDDASGNLTLFIYSIDCGFEVNATYVGSVATIRASEFSKGRYSLEYFTVSDEKYGCFLFTQTSWYNVEGCYGYFVITQELLDPALSVTVSDIDFGESAVINITLNETIAGEVTVSIGDINYTVNAVNGRASLAIPNLRVGTYPVIAIYAGNDLFRQSEASSSFRVNKIAAPEIVITSADSVVEGSDLTVSVSIADATGIVVINGKEYELVDGAASATISNVTVGNMTIAVVYNGDDKYLNASAAKTVNVFAKLNPELTVSVSNINFGEVAVVNVVMNENVNGEVILIVGDANYTVNAVNGKGNMTISGLNADDYNVMAIFKANELFQDDEATTAFRVNKVDSTLTLSGDNVFVFGETVIIEAIYEGATGVSASVVNYTEAVIEINGSSIAVSGLGVGNYILSVYTIADANHNPVAVNTTITVKKPYATVSISPIAFDYGCYGTTPVTYTGAYGIYVGVVNHTEAILNVTDDSITVSGLDAGEYILIVMADADAEHSPVTVNTTITVNKVDSSLVLSGDIAFNYGASKSLTFEIANASNVTATVVNQNTAVIKINGNMITVSGLNAGSYVLKVTTIPDANYNAVSKTVNVKVNQLKTAISAAKVTTTYGTTKNLVVTLKSGTKVLSGKYVVVKLNNKNYKVKTNSKGQATVKVPATLIPKSYKATLTFAGDTNYVKSNGYAYVVVNKAKPVFTAKASASYGVKAVKKYTVVLKSDKGKVIKNAKVTLKVNGKTYSVNTNAKGQAIFKFTNLSKKGTYGAAIKFAGNNCFKPISKTAKIIVK